MNYQDDLILVLQSHEYNHNQLIKLCKEYVVNKNKSLDDRWNFFCNHAIREKPRDCVFYIPSFVKIENPEKYTKTFFRNLLSYRERYQIVEICEIINEDIEYYFENPQQDSIKIGDFNVTRQAVNEAKDYLMFHYVHSFIYDW